MRGKRSGLQRHLAHRRLIPARAGKTQPAPLRRGACAAHPRACGENPSGRTGIRGRTGSSPRVRGKLEDVSAQSAEVRLIPARAGKTTCTTRRSVGAWAHPRACGENGIRKQPETRFWGSSPRVRGKLREGDHAGLPARLIPARAGKTSRSRCGPRSTGAHPRACGENGLDEWPGAPAEGSSPRVRGKLFVGALDQFGLRLIPARAGKTPCPPSPTRPPAAHPRACGENVEEIGYPVPCAGSSPRVRGKPAPGRARRDMEGLIPARAGKTSRSVRGCGSGRAHPRACGENVADLEEETSPDGSSPRVRGKPEQVARQRAHPGLIPARAGKTPGRTGRGPAGTAHPRACGENYKRPSR